MVSRSIITWSSLATCPLHPRLWWLHIQHKINSRQFDHHTGWHPDSPGLSHRQANSPGARLLGDVTPAALTVLQDQLIFNVVSCLLKCANESHRVMDGWCNVNTAQRSEHNWKTSQTAYRISAEFNTQCRLVCVDLQPRVTYMFSLSIFSLLFPALRDAMC